MFSIRKWLPPMLDVVSSSPCRRGVVTSSLMLTAEKFKFYLKFQTLFCPSIYQTPLVFVGHKRLDLPSRRKSWCFWSFGWRRRATFQWFPWKSVALKADVANSVASTRRAYLDSFQDAPLHHHQWRNARLDRSKVPRRKLFKKRLISDCRMFQIPICST